MRAGQKLICDNELDWADDVCTDGCVVDVLDSRQPQLRPDPVSEGGDILQIV